MAIGASALDAARVAAEAARRAMEAAQRRGAEAARRTAEAQARQTAQAAQNTTRTADGFNGGFSSATAGSGARRLGNPDAPPPLLDLARLGASDVVVIDGQVVARPPNDYDFALAGGTPEQRAQARAMINQYILVAQGKTADWLGSALGGPAEGHPYVSISGGQVTGSSVGDSTYYQGAAIKRRPNGSPTAE